MNAYWGCQVCTFICPHVSSPDTWNLQLLKDCSIQQAVWLSVHVVHLCLGGIQIQISVMTLFEVFHSFPQSIEDNPGTVLLNSQWSLPRPFQFTTHNHPAISVDTDVFCIIYFKVWYQMYLHVTKVKLPLLLCTTPWRCSGYGSKDPHTLYLGTRWRWTVTCMFWLLYTRGKSPRYQGTGDRCDPALGEMWWQREKSLLLQGTEPSASIQ